MKKVSGVQTAETLPMKIVAGMFIGAILLGSLTGFGITRFTSASSSSGEQAANTEGDEGQETTGSETVAGFQDDELFPDKAEGNLVTGGLNGEGTYRLLRKGGPSQTIAITSTTIDLSNFVDKKVNVEGRTYEGQAAGWLMDVGYIEAMGEADKDIMKENPAEEDEDATSDEEDADDVSADEDEAMEDEDEAMMEEEEEATE